MFLFCCCFCIFCISIRMYLQKKNLCTNFLVCTIRMKNLSHICGIKTISCMYLCFIASVSMLYAYPLVARFVAFSIKSYINNISFKKKKNIYRLTQKGCRESSWKNISWFYFFFFLKNFKWIFFLWFMNKYFD